MGTLIRDDLGDDAERPRQDRDRGSCPVVIGQRLHGRDLSGAFHGNVSYKILAELGHGADATVWLVREESGRRSHFAIKTLKQAASHDQNREMLVMAKLGKLKAAFYYKHETIQDPFLCLVMAVHGTCLSNRAAKIKPPADMASITAFVGTLFSKVATMHSLNIVHGDLSPNNIVYGLHKDAFKRMGLKAATRRLKETQHTRVPIVFKPMSGRQGTAGPQLSQCFVYRRGRGILTDRRDMSAVEIIDFGRAFEGSQRRGVRGTPSYSAPEVEKHYLTTSKSDLWSLACVILYGLTRQHFLAGCDTYLTSRPGQQMGLISDHLCANDYIRTHDHYRECIVAFLWLLLQPLPEHRNPEAARGILSRLQEAPQRENGDIPNQHVRVRSFQHRMPDVYFCDWLPEDYTPSNAGNGADESEEESEEE